MKITKPKLEAQEYLHSLSCREVSPHCCADSLCLVPQDVCNSDKIGQINNYMYSKIKGEFIQVSKYRDKD